MLGKLINRWIEKDRKQAYQNGFEWACGEILLHKTPLHEVEGAIWESDLPFDRGAQDALDALEALGAVMRDGATLFYPHREDVPG